MEGREVRGSEERGAQTFCSIMIRSLCSSVRASCNDKLVVVLCSFFKVLRYSDTVSHLYTSHNSK